MTQLSNTPQEPLTIITPQEPVTGHSPATTIGNGSVPVSRSFFWLSAPLLVWFVAFTSATLAPAFTGLLRTDERSAYKNLTATVSRGSVDYVAQISVFGDSVKVTKCISDVLSKSTTVTFNYTDQSRVISIVPNERILFNTCRYGADMLLFCFYAEFVVPSSQWQAYGWSLLHIEPAVKLYMWDHAGLEDFNVRYSTSVEGTSGECSSKLQLAEEVADYLDRFTCTFTNDPCLNSRKGIRFMERGIVLECESVYIPTVFYKFEDTRLSIDLGKGRILEASVAEWRRMMDQKKARFGSDTREYTCQRVS